MTHPPLKLVVSRDVWVRGLRIGRLRWISARSGLGCRLRRRGRRRRVARWFRGGRGRVSRRFGRRRSRGRGGLVGLLGDGGRGRGRGSIVVPALAVERLVEGGLVEVSLSGVGVGEGGAAQGQEEEQGLEGGQEGGMIVVQRGGG